MLQAELEDKERKHFRTKGGSDFEGKLLMHLIGHFSSQNAHSLMSAQSFLTSLLLLQSGGKLI